MADLSLQSDIAGPGGWLLKQCVAQLSCQLCRQVGVVDTESTCDGTMLITAVQVDVVISVMVVVELVDGADNAEVGLLGLVSPLAFGIELGGDDAQFLFCQQLSQAEAVGRHRCVKHLVGIHLELQVHISGTTLDDTVQHRLSLSVVVEGARQVQVADTGEFLRQLKRLGQEVDTGLCERQSVHLQMPCRLLLPIGYPSVGVDVDIAFLGSGLELWDIDLLIRPVEVGCQ